MEDVQFNDIFPWFTGERKSLVDEFCGRIKCNATDADCWLNGRSVGDGEKTEKLNGHIETYSCTDCPRAHHVPEKGVPGTLYVLHSVVHLNQQ